jgi:hypothetical protein
MQVPEPEHEGRETEQTEEGSTEAAKGFSAAEDAKAGETDEERRKRRAHFLRELNEAKALRDRVQPRRARAARMRQQMRMRTFRW